MGNRVGRERPRKQWINATLNQISNDGKWLFNLINLHWIYTHVAFFCWLSFEQTVGLTCNNLSLLRYPTQGWWGVLSEIEWMLHRCCWDEEDEVFMQTCNHGIQMMWIKNLQYLYKEDNVFIREKCIYDIQITRIMYLWYLGDVDNASMVCR